jgi:hypothetical protein
VTQQVGWRAEDAAYSICGRDVLQQQLEVDKSTPP